MTQPAASAMGPKARAKSTLSQRRHVEHLSGIFVLVAVQIVVVMNFTHLITDLTFVLGLGGRDFILGLFYAEEFL